MELAGQPHAGQRAPQPERDQAGLLRRQGSKLRVSLWGKNLTDEEYINWGIDFGALGWAGATYGEPRTYGLDVVYTYE
jgi:outer membrane receptor protein involved in Fe transport